MTESTGYLLRGLLSTIAISRGKIRSIHHKFWGTGRWRKVELMKDEIRVVINNFQPSLKTTSERNKLLLGSRELSLKGMEFRVSRPTEA